MCRRYIYFAIIALFASLALVLVGNTHITKAAGGTISGRIINDLDSDGDLNDTGEPGLVGWRIVLERDVGDGEKPLVREIRTSRDGKYAFDNLPMGSYGLSIPCDGQPKLWIGAWPNRDGSYGTNITEDSPDNGYLDFLLKTLDVPPAKGGSIQGKLVWDANRDGVAEASEPGVAGWQVNGGDGGTRCFPQPYQVTYTAADGSFRFDGLMAGGYGLDGFGPSGVPHPDYASDSPGSTVQSGDGYASFWFQPKVDVPENGTGNLLVGLLNMSGTSSISGSVYWDQNSNGVHDAGEPLVDCDCWMGLMYRTPNGYAAVDSRITTAAQHGIYSYSDLVAGDYWVAIMQPPGVGVSPPPGQSGFSFRLISVGEGGSIGNVDFGIAPCTGCALPTVAPQSTPEPPPSVLPTTSPPPTEGTPASVGAVGAPDTGIGPSSVAGSDRLPDALAAAIGLLGLAAVAFAVRRRIDARARR